MAIYQGFCGGENPTPVAPQAPDQGRCDPDAGGMAGERTPVHPPKRSSEASSGVQEREKGVRGSGWKDDRWPRWQSRRGLRHRQAIDREALRLRDGIRAGAPAHPPTLHHADTLVTSHGVRARGNRRAGASPTLSTERRLPRYGLGDRDRHYVLTTSPGRRCSVTRSPGRSSRLVPGRSMCHYVGFHRLSHVIARAHPGAQHGFWRLARRCPACRRRRHTPDPASLVTVSPCWRSSG